MPCVPGQRNGGRAQHRLQYLSAFGPDRRFALDSRLGAVVPVRKPRRAYVENSRSNPSPADPVNPAPQSTPGKQVEDA
jgi:hypothetical protein